MEVIIKLLWILYLLNFIYCDTVSFYKGIFNEDRKITFAPDIPSEYFGYSVLLSDLGFQVGAPKAKSRTRPIVSTGLVFNCSLDIEDGHNKTCSPLLPTYRLPATFVDDMWYGATLGALNKERLYICAPRWSRLHEKRYILANGVCFAYVKKRNVYILLNPFGDSRKQAFHADKVRPGYEDSLHFYAEAQFGMSLKVCDDKHVIFGAPGLLQWTGGTVDYYSDLENTLNTKKRPVTNPFYTEELQLDDYFGYSVEAGSFENKGKILRVAGAPRSKNGLGQVFLYESAIQENAPLRIRQIIVGRHTGAYYGASLCCVDINNDGRLDLLVGAPTFTHKDGGLHYDQGAVFVYINRDQNSTFSLEESGFVSGSKHSGAHFGISIADLGDVDGDGYNDVAVGAPWENEGSGVVYIYQGSDSGLKNQYAQRILVEGARGLGISISKGYDVDNNFCNDVVIGAYASQTAYLLKCVPTVKVETEIKVPNLMDLPEDANNFTAYFCVSVRTQKWQHINVDFKATKMIDPELNRAFMDDHTESVISVKPGIEKCDEHVVNVNRTADLSKPILIRYKLEPSKLDDFTRLSEDSKLETSFLAQMIGDCGKDLICTPLLKMRVEPMDSPYIPGTNMKLGAKITIINEEEPAYGAKLQLMLPLTPIRVPRSCNLKKLNMTCNLPAPLHRNESVVYEIELQYEYDQPNEMKLLAELKEPLYRENVTEGALQELTLTITPKAKFAVTGKSLSNATIFVSREQLKDAKNFTLIYSYEVTNLGPSDWHNLTASISLSEPLSVSVPVAGCTPNHQRLDCTWTVYAKHTKTFYMLLHYDLSRFGKLLETNITINVTSKFELKTEDEYKMAAVTTCIVLEPVWPIWPLIAGVIGGLLILVVVTIIMYMLGFFKRRQKEELQKLLEETASQPEPSVSGNSATQEKDSDDSIELDSD
ncbi:integrin alpha-PS3-like isoform X2 [Achroia grisella]|nr:integrin alpha-PS3-like isoform X2 [Achroia grisella]XP_059055537.1 integrin alpha-PS3-like isoform X2 [Achroia grisella]XP_059055538.1 integrin alpha-PS3-like isoform X2 [Achroia grisella]